MNHMIIFGYRPESGRGGTSDKCKPILRYYTNQKRKVSLKFSLSKLCQIHLSTLKALCFSPSSLIPTAAIRSEVPRRRSGDDEISGEDLKKIQIQ